METDDDEVDSDGYDQKRNGEGGGGSGGRSGGGGRGSGGGGGGVSSRESKGMPMTSEEIIQDYQRSVARVKNLQGRVKQHDDDWEEVVGQEDIDTGRGTGRDTGRGRVGGGHEEDDRTASTAARTFASTTDTLDDNRTPFLSSPRSPLRTMTGGSPMDASASQQVDQLLNDMSTAIASVQLPSELSLTSITLIHMPDLVART